MSSNCLACTDPIAPCQGCKSTQQCIQVQRSCTQCPRNICVDPSSRNSSKSAGPSTGTTAGAAVGGVVGVAVVILAVWWFWWRPKGLEQSRKRYSKHLMNRQSRLGAADKRKTGVPAGADGDVATKRTSVHLRMDAGAHNRRSTPATGNLLDGADETVPVSRTSDDDNPFGDQNRSSIGTFGITDDNASTHTSEFSFRSSHSTNIIPIAYIPPHSSSISVDDAQGRVHPSRNASPSSQAMLPRRTSTNHRASIPTSMASRDSLALAGAEIIELHPLPPVLTPDTPSIPHGTMANGAPVRPPRSPGLDLQLPKTSSPLASPPINSPHLPQRMSRPPSGFPFAGSSSSSGSPTSPTYPQHQLLPPNSQQPRTGSSQSHLSVMSSFTSRSGNSTMSYILDPPQIITPVNAQGVKRVEFQQAKAHKLQGGGAGAVGILSPSSPTSPLAVHDPFSDDASVNTDGRGGETGSASRPVSASSRWTSSSLASDASEAVQFLQGQSITFTNPNSPLPLSATTVPMPGSTQGARGMSTLSVDLPRSARSSQSYSIVDGNRQSTWSSTSESIEGGRGQSSQSMSRTSTGTASTHSHDSLLEGIPFMAPPARFSGGGEGSGRGGGPSTSSVNLSLPINVTVPIDSSPNASATNLVAPSSEPGTSVPPTPTTVRGLAAVEPIDRARRDDDDDEDDFLPAPFLPFAGQRPSPTKERTSTSSTAAAATAAGVRQGERVQSEQFSVRSGFGSGLSQIPFQLGFPSGFGDGDGDGDEDGLDATRHDASAAKEDASDPFGAHAEVEDRSDPRASMDTLALHAALSASLDAQT
ncbi:hypothetical protein JCM11491_001530 [Sporobolomyces phaffii]